MFLYVNLGCFFDGNGMEPAWTKRNPQLQVNNEGFCNSLCHIMLWYFILFYYIKACCVMLCYVILWYFLLYHLIKYVLMLYYLMLLIVCLITWYSTILFVIPCYVKLYCIVLCYVMVLNLLLSANVRFFPYIRQWIAMSDVFLNPESCKQNL